MGLVSNVLLLLGIGGCNPINTYRNWIGVSANDPNPERTPNTKNLAVGEAGTYPNLATVPPPPSRALTTAELDKLTQNLIADRANAKYTSEHLQAQFDEAIAPPSPPPSAMAVGEAKAVASSSAATTSTVLATGPSAAATPAAGGPGAAPGAALASNRGAVSTPSAAAAPAPVGPRKSGQTPEPGPLESSLRSPEIASLPQPEQYRPGPPTPPELSVPAGAKTPNATAPGAHLPAPAAPEPIPAAIGSAQFQPAPSPPQLAPAAPVRVATAAGPGRATKPSPPSLNFEKVADVAFPDNGATLSDADRQALDKIAARYHAKPGLVRVVGFAGVSGGAAEQLTGYRTALDRAQAVADGLAKAGIPANKIQTEAAPAGSTPGQGHAEILFQQ
ncbi:MAG: OmpA family protein [Alphaproteobacteria bacterium]|nr:OmpA family protein [Alphaproteobacteria bacterium]